jgi:hypothetical protein
MRFPRYGYGSSRCPSLPPTKTKLGTAAALLLVIVTSVFFIGVIVGAIVIGIQVLAH